jgi:hypothetical protein
VGTRIYLRQKSAASGAAPVGDAVAENTIDQRIDWAAVMSFPIYEPDRECTFRVYDPNTGNSLVHVKVGRREQIQVPAGGFDGVLVTYRIDKNRGAEVYRLTMDRSSRFLVKEEFPNGAVNGTGGDQPLGRQAMLSGGNLASEVHGRSRTWRTEATERSCPGNIPSASRTRTSSMLR